MSDFRRLFLKIIIIIVCINLLGKDQSGVFTYSLNFSIFKNCFVNTLPLKTLDFGFAQMFFFSSQIKKTSWTVSTRLVSIFAPTGFPEWLALFRSCSYPFCDVMI